MTWRAGIRARLLLLALLPACAIAASLSLYFVLSGMSALDAELRQRGQAIVRHLAPASEYGVFSGNRVILQALAQATLQQPDVLAVSITDAAGRVLAMSGRTHFDPSRFAQPLEGPTLLADGNDWLGFGAPIWRSRADVDDIFSLTLDRPPKATSGESPVGRVYVELDTDAIDERKQHLLLTSLLILLGGLGLTAALALRMGQSVSRPVALLARAVGRMAGGDLATRVDATSPGELGELERGFNHMAERLEDIHHTMRQRIDEATAALAHQAAHDPLTGLINRREFEIRLERAIRGARDNGACHVLCYLDLDQFKIVNDTCGHPAGDALLRQLTHLLRGRVRGEDTLARLGGDEFGVLLENCRLDDALRVAENLRALVGEFRFAWDDRQFAVGVSIGVALIDEHTANLAEVLSAADVACYAAKAAGRNRVEIFRPDDKTLAQRERDGNWEDRIRRALAEDRLLLHAQSVRALAGNTEAVLCCEVFLRMRAEDGGLVMPGAFLPAAERGELLAPLEAWVIEHTCATIAPFVGDSGCERFTCAINLSGPSLARADTIDHIAASLERHHLSPRHLCFELSEACIARDLAAAQAFVEQLRLLGCRVAIDDFGSGVSAFQYLRQLKPDYVKIDPALVSGLAESEINRTLVRAIHQIAHQLGIITVAEAVDSQAALHALESLDIDYAQGHELARPEPFAEWVAGEATRCRARNGGCQHFRPHAVGPAVVAPFAPR